MLQNFFYRLPFALQAMNHSRSKGSRINWGWKPTSFNSRSQSARAKEPFENVRRARRLDVQDQAGNWAGIAAKAEKRGNLLFAWVAADELYGDSPTFRDGVDALGKWYSSGYGRNANGLVLDREELPNAAHAKFPFLSDLTTDEAGDGQELHMHRFPTGSIRH